MIVNMYLIDKSNDKMLHVTQSESVKKDVINGKHDFSCLVKANGHVVIDYSIDRTLCMLLLVKKSMFSKI